MHDAFILLGLGLDADASAIKRAYAQRLRKTRPDEDPVAFQALNEAYRRCLELAASRGDEDDEGYDPHADEAEAAADAPPVADAPDARDETATATAADHDKDDDAPQFVRVRFDVHDFLSELRERAQRDPAPALDAWLRGLEPLYSLELKRALHEPVAALLADDEPLPPQAMRLIMQFFDLDEVSQGDDWRRRRLADRLHLAQEALALEQEIARYTSSTEKPVDRLLMRELLGPRRWLRRLFLLLMPLLPSRALDLARTLLADYPNFAGERLSEESVRYWERAADRDSLDWRRLMVAPLRVPLYYLGLIALMPMLPTGDVHPLQAMATHCAVAATTLLAFVILTTATRRLAEHLERERAWYPGLVYAGLWFIGTLIASLWWPSAAIALLVAIGYVWSLPRAWIEHLVVAAAMASGAFVVYAFGRFLVDNGQTDTLEIVSGAYAGAIPILHDLIYARFKRITLDETRRQLGWLGKIAIAHVLLAMAWPLCFSLLKD